MLKLLTILAALFLLGACQSEPEIEDDGTRVTYFAMESRSSHNDWQDFILIEVDAQEYITYIRLDGINPMVSSTRRESARLEWSEGIADSNFYEQIHPFEEALIGQPVAELTALLQEGDHDEFEPSNWIALAVIALSTDPIERGPYLEGLYQSMSEESVDGFYYFVNFIVVYGHLIEIQWNAITEDGFLKYDDILMMGIGDDSDVRQWRDQAILLEEALIRLQDPMLFTFDEDGYATDIAGVHLQIEPFITLVIQGLAEGPITTDLD